MHKGKQALENEGGFEGFDLDLGDEDFDDSLFSKPVDEEEKQRFAKVVANVKHTPPPYFTAFGFVEEVGYQDLDGERVEGPVSGRHFEVSPVESEQDFGIELDEDPWA